MGGIGAVAEPLLVISLLFGGTWINRDPEPGRQISHRRRTRSPKKQISNEDVESGNSPTSSAGLLSEEDESSDYDGVLKKRSTSPSLLPDQEPRWRKRTIGFFGLSREVVTPNNRRFKGTFMSRLLERYPFMIEVWYWGLIYWVYQLGRAASAVFIVEGTVHAARNHALQVIALEQRLHIFWEIRIQAFFMQAPIVMTWINRIYSFIHIPGSIAFLVWLFYYTNTTKRQAVDSLPTHSRNSSTSSIVTVTNSHNTAITASPRLFEARRRTMALCNLCAFIIFTIYPCMPPRLLSADKSDGYSGKLARSYGFVDTVHGVGGEGSVWTQNRFCNQYAAMPSLHFGYSLLIGLTIMTIPLKSISTPLSSRKSFFLGKLRFRMPSAQRIICIVVGVLYPLTILTAILATANHFILDAVAGACVCGVAWWGNDVLLNLLVLEDWFFSIVRISRPLRGEVEEVGAIEDEWARSKGGFVE